MFIYSSVGKHRHSMQLQSLVRVGGQVVDDESFAMNHDSN